MLSKKILVGSWLLASSTVVCAQISTNSPYTRYGLGDMFDQSFTNNAAMGGVGYALRTPEHINAMNPASYTAVDSLSFIFDMTIGYTPFSTVGYNFTRSKEIENSSDVTISNNFYGDGGLQQIFGGIGFKILDNLSIGANIGYLYGKLNYQTTASLSNGGDQTITYNTVSISSYNASFGLQYTQPINKQNELTLGLTYSLGHTLNGHDTQGTQITNGTNYSVVNQQQIDDSYGIPHIYGGGLAWKHKKNLTVEVDYTLQKWSGVKYNNRTDLYQNRSKVAIGAEFLPKEFGRSYFSRIRYRAGAYYANSNLQIPVSQNMIDGPKEYGVSVGLGLPLKLYQRNSVLSITGQYIHANPSVSDMLSENRFVLKIGLTFNEHWFMKWRVN